MEVGRLTGQGREKEEKGKRKGREKEGKGNEKERESEGNYFNFSSFDLFRNGFEIPKQPKQTERGGYILSEKIPKQNQNCQCFGLFRFEPKEKKIRFAGHPSAGLLPCTLIIFLREHAAYTVQYCSRQEVSGYS